MSDTKRNNAILDSLSAHIAVLGRDGKILLTNEAWKQFARNSGNPPSRTAGRGTDYLGACQRSVAGEVSDAQAATQGIQSVLEGRKDFFQLEYACDEAGERRWFLLQVSPFKAKEGGAILCRTDITSRKAAETAALTSESTVGAMLACTAQSVLAVGPDEKIVLLNGNTEKLFGYSRAELLGQPLGLLIPEPLRKIHKRHHRAYFKNMSTRVMASGLELVARRKDGTTFPVEVGLSGIEIPAGKIAVAFVSDITQRRQLEQVARRRARQAQALAASLLTAQEAERRRVSRELHDQICQQLASLAIDIGSFAAAPAPPDRERRLMELQARIIKVSESARHLAYELHPMVLDDLGLVASLRGLCREFSDVYADVKLTFTTGPMKAPVPLEIASCVYRITQASLQNIAKHAKAKHASVSLGLEKGSLILSIRDDGVGFDLGEAQGHGGLGLIGMEERAQMVHGRFTVTTSRGRGTRIALRLPLSGSFV